MKTGQVTGEDEGANLKPPPKLYVKIM